MKVEGDKALYTYTVDGKGIKTSCTAPRANPSPTWSVALFSPPPNGRHYHNKCVHKYLLLKILGNRLVEKGTYRKGRK